MTPTVRDNMLVALEAALAGVVSSDAIEIDPEGPPVAFPGLALFDHGDRMVEMEAMLERREADLTLEGYVRRGSGRDGAADRNNLHARACAAVMADETLGGVVELIRLGDLRKTVIEFSQTGRMSFAQDITIQFTTRRTDPALPA